jgi:hypothetical protein
LVIAQLAISPGCTLTFASVAEFTLPGFNRFLKRTGAPEIVAINKRRLTFIRTILGEFTMESIRFTVGGQRVNHQDANGNPVICIDLKAAEGLGSLHLYMSPAEAQQFPLASAWTLDLTKTE